MLSKARQDEIQEKLISAAFIGWQIGAGAGKRFGEYLEELGLTEKQVTKTEGKEMTAKLAIAKAEEILAMASKKKDQKQ